ncbi:MAG: acetyltransferase [Desulfamplus sp.]|nr:acetyltransferase [Desulfamplus sp.]
MEIRPIIIIGAGGHAKVLISALKYLQREIIGILDHDSTLIGKSIAGVDVLGDDDKIQDYDPITIELVNGIGSVSSPEKRRNLYLKFKDMGYTFAKVIHPSAIIMSDVKTGEGAQIMAGAIVQTGCIIGENVIINTGAILDHECMIGAHNHVAPGAVLSGNVQVGGMVHIGTAATIIQGIKIGEATIIGAGAVVIKNVPSNVKVAGIPASLI